MSEHAITVEVLGEGPAAGIHALAAEDAGLTRVAKDGSIVVAAGNNSHQIELAYRAIADGRRVLIDPPLAASVLLELVEADPSRSLLWISDHRKYAPGWRLVRDLTSSLRAEHASVVISRPPIDGTGTDPLAVLGLSALATVEDLFGDHSEISSITRSGASAQIDVVSVDGARGSLHLTLADGDAVWQAQVASSSEVVTVELSPQVTVERNGEPVPLPTHRQRAARDPRLAELGYIDQLLAISAGVGYLTPADLRRVQLLNQKS